MTKLTPDATAKKEKKRRRDWKTLFVDALSKSPNVTAAAKAAGVKRPYVYAARENDSNFAAAWDSAINEALDHAEGELYRRAVVGFDKPVFYQGDLVTTVKEHSDQLLMFLLKSHRDKYRERTEITGANGKPLIRTARDLTDDELATIASSSFVATGGGRTAKP